MIYDLRFTIREHARPACFGARLAHRALLLAAFCLLQSASAITSFYLTNLDTAGLPITNELTFQVWPPGNTYSVNNGQVIWGTTRRFTPTASGYLSNTIYANVYRVTSTNNSVALYYAIPDTTNVINLANYLTNAAVLNAAGYGAIKGQSSDTAVGFLIEKILALGTISLITNTSGGLTWLVISNAPLTYAMVTNVLGYAPVAPTYASVSNAVGFVLATNGGPISSSQITSGLGYTPLTNTYAAMTNIAGIFATNGGPIAYSQLPYTPPTNSYGGLTNVLGFAPATNTPAGLISGLTYTPATNPPIQLNTNLQFTANGVTNTLYITNSFPQRVSTP